MKPRSFRKVAIEHQAADARCGREWTCQCGHCRRARVDNINAAFKKLEQTERRAAAVRALIATPVAEPEEGADE